MGVLASFKAARRQADVSNTLYLACVEQARAPVFFTNFGVPDTVDGRFDLIILHTMLLIRRLRRQGKEAAKLSQATLNHMFSDMDRNLREMGVGDLSVGKQVKKMAKAFYGRAEVWEEAMDKDGDTLPNALIETLFRAVNEPGDGPVNLAAYVTAADSGLRNLPDEQVLAGNLEFPSPQLENTAA